MTHQREDPLDFPCSRIFREWAAEEYEGIYLPVPMQAPISRRMEDIELNRLKGLVKAQTKRIARLEQALQKPTRPIEKATGAIRLISE